MDSERWAVGSEEWVLVGVGWLEWLVWWFGKGWLYLIGGSVARLCYYYNEGVSGGWQIFVGVIYRTFSDIFLSKNVRKVTKKARKRTKPDKILSFFGEKIYSLHILREVLLRCYALVEPPGGLLWYIIRKT